MAFLAGNAVGTVRHAIEGQPRPPRMLRDFVKGSVLFAKNRGPVAPEQSRLDELAAPRAGA